jgi:hypothetical protein
MPNLLKSSRDAANFCEDLFADQEGKPTKATTRACDLLPGLMSRPFPENPFICVPDLVCGKARLEMSACLRPHLAQDKGDETVNDSGMKPSAGRCFLKCVAG